MFFTTLQNRCKEKNIKITPLLLELNLSKGNISKWKVGTLPNGEILIKLADYLDCSIDYLLGRTDVPEVNHRTGLVSNSINIIENETESHDLTKLSEPIIRPMVGVTSAGKPLEMTVGCYDMIKINAVSDMHKKISPQDFTVEIHGDSMIDAGIYNGDYVVIHPCPMAENGEIALVAVAEDCCTLKKFYRTDSGIELHPCNHEYKIQKYKLSDGIRIMGIFVCTCAGEIIEQ